MLPSRLRAACHLPYPVGGVGLLRIASAFRVLFPCTMHASSPAATPPFMQGISFSIPNLCGRRHDDFFLHSMVIEKDRYSFAFLMMDTLLVCKIRQVFQDIHYRSENIITTIQFTFATLAALLQICQSLCPKSSQLCKSGFFVSHTFSRPSQYLFIQSRRNVCTSCLIDAGYRWPSTRKHYCHVSLSLKTAALVVQDVSLVGFV